MAQAEQNLIMCVNGTTYFVTTTDQIILSLSYQIAKHGVVAATKSFGNTKVVRKTGIKVRIGQQIQTKHDLQTLSVKTSEIFAFSFHKD